MKYRQVFNIDNQYLGESQVSHIIVHAEKQPPRSQVWVCDICLTTWAVIKRYDIFNNKLIPGEAIVHKCRQCEQEIPRDISYCFFPSGSIIGDCKNKLSDLPEEVLRRELYIELDTIEYLIKRSKEDAAE